MLHWFQSTDFSHAPLTSVMLHWLQACSTDISHAPLTSVHWFQSCSTDFSPLISVMLHWLQSCSTDFSHAPLISVMLHWLQSCSTDFSHAPLISVMLHWLQSCSTDFSHAPLILVHWSQWSMTEISRLKSVEHDWIQWSMTEISGLKSVEHNQKWCFVFYFWKFSMFIWVKFIQKQQKYPKKEDCEFCAWASHFIMNYKITVKYIRISSCNNLYLNYHAFSAILACVNEWTRFSSEVPWHLPLIFFWYLISGIQYTTAVFRVTNSTTCPSFVIVSLFVSCTVIFILIEFWLSRNNKLPEINTLCLALFILVGS